MYQCPKCVLRFSYRTEMEYHLREDHRRRGEPEPAAQVDAAPAALERAAPEPGGPTGPVAGRSRAHLAAWLLAVASVLLVAYVAAFVSILTGVVVGVLLLVLNGIYVRGARGRARVPRR